MYGSSKVLSPPVSPEIKVLIRSVFFPPTFMLSEFEKGHEGILSKKKLDVFPEF